MRILILPDRLDWALGHVANALIKYMPHHSFSKKKLHRHISRRSSRCDVTFVMYPPYVLDFNSTTSHFIAGVNSFIELGVLDPHTDLISSEMTEKLSLYERIGVPCRSLQMYLKKNNISAFYTPYGIDPDLFYPKQFPKNKQLVVGFAGNPMLSIKGLADFIQPAVEAVEGVELKTALLGAKMLTHADMVDFYNSIDLLVCMSKSETGPMPVMEAMACGVPVISTSVGLVPEIVTNGVDGIIVDRDTNKLIHWLEHFVNNRESINILGQRALKTIQQKWTWTYVIGEWEKFISFN